MHKEDPARYVVLRYTETMVWDVFSKAEPQESRYPETKSFVYDFALHTIAVYDGYISLSNKVVKISHFGQNFFKRS